MSPHRTHFDIKLSRIAPWRGYSLIPASSQSPESAKLQKTAAERGLDFTKFPSTRYQGSKRKIIPWLWSHINDLDFLSALDVFGGTGSVSYLLKKMGKHTTYNDYLRFNHQIGQALVENDDVTLTHTDIHTALTSSSRRNQHGFIRRTFKGVYFTDQENEWLDKTVVHINTLTASPYKRALMHYALFQSCLVKRPFNLFHRRNLYVRFARTKRQFGNKTTWDRPFDEVFTSFCTEASAFVFKGAKRCKAVCHDALEIPSVNYDLVYIDPPYLRGDKTTNSYLEYYHFLEGLSRYADWSTLIDYDTINLRMKRDQLDLWANPSKRMDALNALFDKFKSSILVLSYKRFGVPSIDTLIKMLKKHGRKVRSHSRHYKYALNHQNGSAGLNREVLLIAE